MKDFAFSIKVPVILLIQVTSTKGQSRAFQKFSEEPKELKKAYQCSKRAQGPERTLKEFKGAKNQISKSELTEVDKYCKIYK